MKLTPESLVLFSDESLLVINKPAGLPSLPDGYDPEAPHLRSVLAPAYGPLWIVHRLDRDTSGLIVLARSEDAHRDLNTQFETRQTSKTYHALVAGRPDWNERTVKLRLRADGDRQHRTVVDNRQGKRAVTHLRVLEQLGRFSLIEAAPETGRTHQIRVHLAAVGLPIAADGLYGSGEGIYLSQFKAGYQAEDERPLLGRLGLHAFALEFLHPESGEAVRFEAPYPKDLRAVLNQLRKNVK